MKSTPSAHRSAVATAASAASLALGLALTGCAGATTPAASPSASSSPASASPATSATSAGTAATPATAAPEATSSPSGAADPPSAAPTLATFTFPDGRVSFDYPSDWTVDVFHAAEAAVPTATATVKDAGGRTMATVNIGRIGDVVGESGTRTAYESVPVPGLAGFPAPAPHVSFFRVESGGVSHYTLAVTAGAVQSGENVPGQAPVVLVQTGTGVMTAETVWDSPTPFASEDAAKGWYASAEGRAVRALLLSLRAK